MTQRRLPFQAALVAGILLAIAGVGAYLAIEDAHVTTLIPAIFGVLFVGLGRYGLESDGDRTAAYGIGLLAVLGIAGSLRVVPDLIALASGEPVDAGSIAVASQSLMILLSLVVLVAVVRFLLSE